MNNLSLDDLQLDLKIYRPFSGIKQIYSFKLKDRYNNFKFYIPNFIYILLINNINIFKYNNNDDFIQNTNLVCNLYEFYYFSNINTSLCSLDIINVNNLIKEYNTLLKYINIIFKLFNELYYQCEFKDKGHGGIPLIGNKRKNFKKNKVTNTDIQNILNNHLKDSNIKIIDIIKELIIHLFEDCIEYIQRHILLLKYEPYYIKYPNCLINIEFIKSCFKFTNKNGDYSIIVKVFKTLNIFLNYTIQDNNENWYIKFYKNNTKFSHYNFIEKKY